MTNQLSPDILKDFVLEYINTLTPMKNPTTCIVLVRRTYERDTNIQFETGYVGNHVKRIIQTKWKTIKRQEEFGANKPEQLLLSKVLAGNYVGLMHDAMKQNAEIANGEPSHLDKLFSLMESIGYPVEELFLNVVRWGSDQSNELFVDSINVEAALKSFMREGRYGNVELKSWW